MTAKLEQEQEQEQEQVQEREQVQVQELNLLVLCLFCFQTSFYKNDSNQFVGCCTELKFFYIRFC